MYSFKVSIPNYCKIIAEIGINHNGDMFQFAEENNYLVKNKDNSTFLTQATSFKFGIVDLTNSKAYIWFKNIIKTN